MKFYKIYKLPSFLRDVQHNIRASQEVEQHLSYRIDQIEESNKGLKEALNEAVNAFKQENDRLMQRSTEMEHLLSVATAKVKNQKPRSAKQGQELFAENHMLDAFYLEFENHFRGTEAEIGKKQSVYLKHFKASSVNFNKYPVVDLGAGRGEFIALLKNAGINAYGVDLNESMVETAKSHGLKMVLSDAISFLQQQPSGSLGAITGFHLAEHIPFDLLLTLISEAYRCLTNEGILLLETPNPESVYVGAFTFHYDPSHLKPIPPAIMQFSAKFKGFKEAEILRMQPEVTSVEIKKASNNKLLQEGLKRLFGPRDYALLATK